MLQRRFVQNVTIIFAPIALGLKPLHLAREALKTMCPKCGHYICENCYVKFISEEVSQLLQKRNEY
jgi:hypothetical protein